MRKSYVRIPVYTGDVSGFASALYELGGMLVIHDPSGCNSTYNTHDEVRWYDKESLIFISGLNDIDAITGNDDKLINDTVSAAKRLNPRFIALANSPIPYLNGTDFEGICRIIENRTGLPCFYVKTNAMHDYTVGASGAYLAFAKKFLKAGPDPDRGNIEAKASGANGKQLKRVNIIGVTPLDYTSTTIDVSGRYDVISNWSYGTDFDSIMRSPEADLNIVMSSCGLAVAKYMEKTFGIPYQTGNSYLELPRGKSRNYIVGEPVTSGIIARKIKLEYGMDFNIVATTEITDGLLSEVDDACHGEDMIKEKIADGVRIIADPLYRVIAPPTAEFIELPHFALSGRLYLKRIPNLFNLEEYYHES
ncbi:MAG: nitrogenase component 1 [Saccharofermentans sp.]|jgi:hypothetical protein|nr:nitrogenase component 1 [Mageeibacillus sp.]MCI1264551.1 nitrogenase component 1 [Saccharofermentans sp.]MCI1275044.1 nitrogenase component 1 [Saccharofermentans sp.]